MIEEHARFLVQYYFPKLYVWEITSDEGLIISTVPYAPYVTSRNIGTGRIHRCFISFFRNKRITSQGVFKWCSYIHEK